MTKDKFPIGVERIGHAIVVVRGVRVMLDRDLAEIYGVTTKRLNEQVKRNRRRFPSDFMFQLTAEEAGVIRSQIATLEIGRGRHRKFRPYAFTEHGTIQAANVLRSVRAIEMSIYLVRAFVQLRAFLLSNRELSRRLDLLEARIERKISAHDSAIAAMIASIRELMNPPAPRRRGIGFTADLDAIK